MPDQPSRVASLVVLRAWDRLAELLDADAELAEEARQALVSAGQAGVEELRRVGRDREWCARAHAAIALAQLGEPQPCASLISLLASFSYPDEDGRAYWAWKAVVAEVVARRCPRAALVLARAAEYGGWDYQADVAVELGLLRDPGAVPTLHALLVRRDPIITANALGALEQINSTEAKEALRWWSNRSEDRID
ncbi:MAG: HEAT repeat domain-containing protein [Gaiellaceae bacterium]|jgi:HEAT repeat protein